MPYLYLTADIKNLLCESEDIHWQIFFPWFHENTILLGELIQWTIPLKEAASLLWYFYRDPLRSLTF